MIHSGIIARPSSIPSGKERYPASWLKRRRASRTATPGQATESPLSPAAGRRLASTPGEQGRSRHRRQPVSRAKSLVLSRGRSRSVGGELASCLRHILCQYQIHSLGEGPEVVAKILREPQDKAGGGISRACFVIFFTLSRYGTERGVRSSIKPALIMTVVAFSVF